MDISLVIGLSIALAERECTMQQDSSFSLLSSFNLFLDLFQLWVMFILFPREVIFGYKDLKIKLYYSACRLTTYIGIEYSTKVSPDLCDGVVVCYKPDKWTF